MRVLVTGGAGYVGSHCVAALIDAGHEVTVLDNLANGHIQAIHADAAFVKADLSCESHIDEILGVGRYDSVLHFAAFLEVGESVRNPLKYYENNVVNSCRLLALLQKHGIQRIVFSSTAAVYGQPECVPISEHSPLSPVNPYGRTKLAIEWAIQDCVHAWGLGGIALRYFNACGAIPNSKMGEDHNPETHLIPLVLQVANGQRANINIFGTDYPTPDGTCVRDYIHVCDLADAHVRALLAIDPGKFRAYNVGTGHGVSVREVIDACRRVTGHSIPHADVSRRPGDPAQLFADPGRIERDLGWRAKWTSIDDIVDSAWSWHRQHPHGFRDVVESSTCH